MNARAEEILRLLADAWLLVVEPGYQVFERTNHGVHGETGALRREAIFWHYPHYHGQGATPYGAIRSGDWRLIEFYDDGHRELYNLREDIGETRNLAASRADLAKSLWKKLADWRREVGAQMPTPNPNYDAEQDAKWDPYGKGKTFSEK